MRSFRTAEKVRPSTQFDLDGRIMTFTAPSWAPVLFSVTGNENDPFGIVTILLDWLGAGLSPEDGEHILARLKDPEDPFDIDDSVTLIQGLIEDTVGRPTTPPSDSSPSVETTASTDGRHLVASTPGS